MFCGAPLLLLQREVVSVGKHLTDKQKKRIIADYATLGNYSAVARKHKISHNTVKRVVGADPQTGKKIQQKRADNTADILQYMEEQKGTVNDIILLYLEELKKPERISKASVQSLAVSLGIVIDKFTGTPNEVEKLKAEIAKLRGEQRQHSVHPLVSDLVAAVKKNQEAGHAE